MKRVLLVLVVLLMITVGNVNAEEKPLIGFGDYNEDVLRLHQKLNELGLYELRAESPYGPESKEIVKALQRYLDMDATGTIADQGELDRILAIDSIDRAALALAQIEENLFVNVEYSAGALANDEGGYTFVTDVEGNAFNAVQWQLCQADGTFIEYFDSEGIGTHEGDYLFTHESGEYVIRFKANSNKKDEDAAKKVLLENNYKYHFYYCVNFFEATKVKTENVFFGLKR